MNKLTLLTRLSPATRLWIAALTFALPSPALAYIGPGAGLGAASVLIALIIGLLLLVVGLVWYPLKRLLKGRKSASEESKDVG